jgi:hypothetical protein
LSDARTGAPGKSIADMTEEELESELGARGQ